MKYLFYLVIVAFIIGCNANATKDEVKDFIPGIYVRAAEHELGAEHDTVIIKIQNESANEYKLNRRWKYARVMDGKPVEPEYKNTLTSGIYNSETKILQETETGDSYSFDVIQNAMFAGKTKYNKLK
jgi:hypothetical protein